MKTKNIIIISGILILSVFGINAIGKTNSDDASLEQAEDIEKISAVVHKSPTCGCCVSFTSFINTQGFDAQLKTEEDMNPIKEEYNIPIDMQSCHTTIIGDYFVEGHIPVEAITKLLAEKPDIDGIALPGMPAGSPGMPGVKSEEFVIYSLKDGVASVFMTL